MHARHKTELTAVLRELRAAKDGARAAARDAHAAGLELSVARSRADKEAAGVRRERTRAERAEERLLGLRERIGAMERREREGDAPQVEEIKGRAALRALRRPRRDEGAGSPVSEVFLISQSVDLSVSESEDESDDVFAAEAFEMRMPPRRRRGESRSVSSRASSTSAGVRESPVVGARAGVAVSARTRNGVVMEELDVGGRSSQTRLSASTSEGSELSGLSAGVFEVPAERWPRSTTDIVGCRGLSDIGVLAGTS